MHLLTYLWDDTMRVGCRFIIFAVNKMYKTGFELKTREEEDASACCTLQVLHRGFVLDTNTLFTAYCVP